MNLLAYIQGRRKGKDAHSIEREAMQDPFLADALDGFDAIDGDHAERITAIRARLSTQEQKSNRKFAYIGIAASLLLCVSIGSYFLINNRDDQSLIAKSEQPLKEEEIEKKKQVVTEILDDSDKQVQSNVEAVEREAAGVLSSPSQQQQPIVQEEQANAVDESVVMENADIQLPEIAVADVQDIQPTGDTLMIAQAEAKQPGRVATSSSAAQRALTTSDSSLKPEPKIGMGAYKKYLKESMVRPEAGDCAKKKGNVIVAFKINAEGKPHSFVYRKKLCEDLDKEAIRLIENGPVWVGDTDKSVMLEVKF